MDKKQILTPKLGTPEMDIFIRELIHLGNVCSISQVVMQIVINSLKQKSKVEK
jgi:hypothetical protein